MIAFPFNSRSNRTTIASLLSALLLLPFVGQWPTTISAQTTASATVIESGKFRLHKFAQPIGEESYEVTRDGDALVMKTNFLFTDRGSPVPLTTTCARARTSRPKPTPSKAARRAYLKSIRPSTSKAARHPSAKAKTLVQQRCRNSFLPSAVTRRSLCR